MLKVETEHHLHRPTWHRQSSQWTLDDTGVPEIMDRPSASDFDPFTSISTICSLNGHQIMKRMNIRPPKTNNATIAAQTRYLSAKYPEAASTNRVHHMAIRPGFTGPSPRTCQLIEGDPSGNDACKCGRRALSGSAYCADHHAQCWQPAPETSEITEI